MKTSISIATGLLIGAGAAGAGANALGSAYQGSDTLFNVTTQAITAAGITDGTYVGGGSGNGQSAMVGGTQQMAPMSRMVNNGNSVCTFAGDAGSGLTAASGIVVGLDAVDVVSSKLLIDGGPGGGGDNGSCNASGGGLANNNTTIDGTVTLANYKKVLALVYGGVNPADGTVDCNSTARQDVVTTWSNLFQNHCANSEAICNDATHGGKLWHAFRRDDASGTSDVFATILGLSPSTSASSNNGFGASPYCNAMNWDASAANKTPACALGAAKQFIGPGGVPEGVCSVTTSTRCSAVGATSVCGHVVQTVGGVADGNGRVCDTVACSSGGTCTAQCPTGESCVALDATHRKPPPGTWGEQPDPGQNTRSFSDVQPTSFQDNDPIRRPCLRNGHNTTTGGEDVCNMDGTLGLVVPIPATEFLVSSLHLRQYPDTIPGDARTKFDVGAGLSVLNCAPFLGSKHSGECPNGDVTALGNCQTPLTATSSQCYSVKADLPLATTRAYLGINDGRIYNAHMRNGGTTAPIPYASETIPVASGGSTLCADGSTCTTIGAACADGSTCARRLGLNFGGDYGRIHAASTVHPSSATSPQNPTACQLADATDQIGCLAQADHCSIGYAGDGSNTWEARSPIATTNGQSNIAPLLVHDVAPSATTVQALGNGPTEYPLARKLYYNSLVGFPTVNGEELTLAKFVASPSINAILTSNDFFTLGSQSPAGTDTPFCEDFNEQTICGASSNSNGCTSNPSGIPTQSTTCGDGTVGPYEECDPAAPVSAWKCSVSGATTCSSTCRC